MDFSWTEEQLKFKKAVIDFAQKELNEGLIDRDRLGELARENWKKCAKMGILGLAVPEEYGGGSSDYNDSVRGMGGLGWGRRKNGFVFSKNAQLVGRPAPISPFGHGAKKKE